MNQIHIQYHKTRVGEFILGAFEERLCLFDYCYRRMRDTIDLRIKKELEADYLECSDPVISKAIEQVDEYLAGNRKLFELPLLMVGSDFQKKVWTALLEIPYGQTESYSSLATKLQNTGAIRAIASANGANAISIIVPCHRVIGSDGKLVGYAGGLSSKKKLLQLEAKNTAPKSGLLF